MICALPHHGDLSVVATDLMFYERDRAAIPARRKRTTIRGGHRLYPGRDAEVDGAYYSG
jgi:hypothetical protein